MTFSPTNTVTKDQRSQKRRGFKIYKTLYLKFGDGALVFRKECNFETRYFRFIKKFFKIIYKKTTRYSVNFKIKCWIPIFPNFPLSKKSKNSRMGKGKGIFVRWVVRIKAGNKLLETKNVSFYRLCCLKFLLQKYLHATTFVLFRRQQTANIYFSFNKNYCWMVN